MAIRPCRRWRNEEREKKPYKVNWARCEKSVLVILLTHRHVTTAAYNIGMFTWFQRKEFFKKFVFVLVITSFKNWEIHRFCFTIHCLHKASTHGVAFFLFEKEFRISQRLHSNIKRWFHFETDLFSKYSSSSTSASSFKWNHFT